MAARADKDSDMGGRGCCTDSHTYETPGHWLGNQRKLPGGGGLWLRSGRYREYWWVTLPRKMVMEKANMFWKDAVLFSVVKTPRHVKKIYISILKKESS